MRRTGEHRFASLSDGQLLEAARDGDRAAFGELWERHRLAGIVAAKNLAPSLDPDDLVSEAYLRVFELVRDGRGPEGAFRPYLYQVIRSAAANRFRAGEQAAGELPDVPDLSETAPWDDSAFDLKAAAQAFATLSPRWRAALWYTEVEGMPPREAAPLLGLSPNSASALAARARDALRSAWVDEHVNRDATEEACRSTLQQLQRYQRGKLTAKRSREITAHLAECESCAKAAAESATLNRRLGLVLMWGTLGSAGTGMLAEQLGLADQIGLAGAADA
ncbi:sigma-70 family RNA polymerase sigma factor, partial [Leucobacter albus]|uniref:sigma-70 family RNA polymerase sigma factor n=1 Tax=Leucobacter albus TaxID=272210 RepID=UPI00363A961E